MMNQKSDHIGKIIVISSVLTTLIVLGVLFVFRESLSQYVVEAALDSYESNAASTIPLSDSEKIVNTIERVNPAVVSVIVTKDVPIYERYYETYDPFGWFGGFSIPRVRENGTEEREVGEGTGFLVSNDGVIVTNRHVVDDTDARYSIVLSDSTVYNVEVLARDTQLDIAILKITDPLESSLSFLQFDNENNVKLGQPVIAIGNALAEFQNSVSVGVISGLSRSIIASDSYGRSEQLDHVIQTDAAINLGNSGGPLLNIDGKVIGVNVATSRGADNIGFALPADVVEQVVQSVLEHGEIIRPFLGVRYLMLDEALAQEFSLSVDYGAYLISRDTDSEIILLDSAADRAGLQAEDIILKVDDVVLNKTDLATVLRSKSAGQTIQLSIKRGEDTFIVPVTLQAAP